MWDHLPVAEAVGKELNLRLAECVGEGAFKATYRSETADKTLRALKVARHDVRSSRLDREVEAMKRCSHPCIARNFAVGTIRVGDKEHWYCIEEYLDGGTLSARVARGLIDPKTAREWGRQVSEAIEHLKQHKLVHRDIKPDNILLRSSSNSAVVSDLGLVRDLSKTSLTDTAAATGPGTPYFASPEQLLNEKLLINWRADQFGLGVTMAIVLFNQHPYADSTAEPPNETLQKVTERKGPSNAFQDLAKQAGFANLISMVRPWPVERLPRTKDLVSSWAEVK